MRILGIIPARYQSSRFPGKPLVDIAGKSMIQRVYEQAKKSSLLSELVVATDDERIYNHVCDFKGHVVMTSSHHQNGTMRCGEVLEKYTGYDVVINIQGDEPLIRPEQIDAVLKLFDRTDVMIGTVVKQLHDAADIANENRIKVVLDKLGNALYFSRSAIPFVQGKSIHLWPESIRYYKHIGIYAWRTGILQELLTLPETSLEKAESLEQLRWLYHGYKISTVETTIETPNVDTPDDVQRVLAAMNK